MMMTDEQLSMACHFRVEILFLPAEATGTHQQLPDHEYGQDT